MLRHSPNCVLERVAWANLFARVLRLGVRHGQAGAWLCHPSFHRSNGTGVTRPAARSTVARRSCGYARLTLCLCGLAGIVGCRMGRQVAAPDAGPSLFGVAPPRSAEVGDAAALEVAASHGPVRRLTGAQFDNAALFMPGAVDGADAPPLAPLIVVNMSWARAVTLDSVQRSVHMSRVAGQPYEVLDHVWFLSGRRDFGSALVVEGYRLSLLLGADGFPIVARVARFGPDMQDRPSYFVSRSLEDAAIERFGPPLPGRAFSVEAPLTRASGSFVAGLFADGPVPMGPYVYLDPNGVGVVTVLCRCAASQVDDFAMTAHYDLVDAPGGERAGDDADDAFWRLTDVLRWPLVARDGHGGGATPEAPR